MLCVGEIFRRHPINKAGAARAEQECFLMLTMTYILVQKGVIYLVTAKKKVCVCCFGEQSSVIWERGLQAGQMNGISVVVGHSGARAALYWASLASEWKSRYLHTQSQRAAISINSTSTFFYRSRHLINLYPAYDCYCLSLKSSAVYSKARAHSGLCWFQVRLVRSLPDNAPEMAKETFFTCPPP